MIPGSPLSPPTAQQPAVRRRTRGPHPVDTRHRPPTTAPVVLRRRRLVTLLLLIVLTMTGAGAWWLFEGRFVPAPALAGMGQADAVRAAEGQGLGVQSTEAFSETVPAGVVMSTDPAAGADLTRGGTVSMVVSKGPERFAMPRIVGLSKDDAAKVLGESNLVVGTVNEDWHEELAPGLVTSASAEAGDPMRRDATIDLTLSKGPRPIRIASQVGRPVDQAQSTLENAGFRVVVKTANSPTVPAAHVVSQNPASGTGYRGHTITLVRSLGPAMVKVPEVKALPTQQAVDALTGAGFKVETKPGDSFLNLGYVQRTDPPAGQEAPEGSTITVFVI